MKPFDMPTLNQNPQQQIDPRSDEIDEAAKESFPASDPPSWTLGTSKKTPPKKDLPNNKK